MQRRTLRLLKEVKIVVKLSHRMQIQLVRYRVHSHNIATRSRKLKLSIVCDMQISKWNLDRLRILNYLRNYNLY